MTLHIRRGDGITRRGREAQHSVRASKGRCTGRRTCGDGGLFTVALAASLVRAGLLLEADSTWRVPRRTVGKAFARCLDWAPFPWAGARHEYLYCTNRSLHSCLRRFSTATPVSRVA